MKEYLLSVKNRLWPEQIQGGESEEMCNTEKDCLQVSGAAAGERSGAKHGGARGAHGSGDNLVGREHGRRPHRHLGRHKPVPCLSQTGGLDIGYHSMP